MATERLALGTAVEISDAVTTVAPLSQTIDVVRRRQLAYAFLKRLLDVVASAALLVMLLPVFAVIAIAIKLDSPGPVFYRAERIGRFGKPFTVVKFRSMRAGCSASPHVQFVRSLLREGKTCDLYKVDSDPRVTRIGSRPASLGTRCRCSPPSLHSPPCPRSPPCFIPPSRSAG